MARLGLELLLLITAVTASPFPHSLQKLVFHRDVNVATSLSQTKVTNSEAFSSGAGNNDNANTSDGVGAGTNLYTCYSGSAADYPSKDEWASFSDMWNANKNTMLQGCKNLQLPTDDTAAQVQMIYNAIQQISQTSLVDHRFILAIVMQESIGCVHVGATNNGITNPGLMQSHNGAHFIGNNATSSQQQASITQMIIDGTQGTSSGDGLVQGINMYGNIYDAARYYNSGKIDSSDLNNAQGATASYVRDVANRMTGWVTGSSSGC